MTAEINRRQYEAEPIADTYWMEWKGHRITPGDVVLLKDSHEEYRFSHLSTAIVSGYTWMNLRDLDRYFKLRSYDVSKIRGVVRKNYKKEVK